jgi:membrane protein implicated in regulation of membrane protease activity
MEWWMWLAGGLVLMVAELATPSGFFIMFFGLGALTVGVASRIGLIGAPWIQWLLFTAVSLAYLLLFRGKLQQRVQPPPPPAIDSLVGVLAIPQSVIEPGAVGRVEVRGSTWSARNGASVPVNTGQRCTVIGVDGLLLTVRPE